MGLPHRLSGPQLGYEAVGDLPGLRGLPGRLHPQLRDKNRLDVGKSQSIVLWTRFQDGNARLTAPGAEITTSSSRHGSAATRSECPPACARHAPAILQ
jgi:hypothetical protein